MRRLADDLAPGEEVRLDVHPHGISILRPVAIALLLVVVGGTLLLREADLHAVVGYVGAAAVVAGAFVGVRAVWRRERTRVLLTSEKLVVVHGILRRRAAAVRLSRVPALELEQTILGRVLGYGTLVAGDLEIPYVPEARRVRRLLG